MPEGGAVSQGNQRPQVRPQLRATLTGIGDFQAPPRKCLNTSSPEQTFHPAHRLFMLPIMQPLGGVVSRQGGKAPVHEVWVLTVPPGGSNPAVIRKVSAMVEDGHQAGLFIRIDDGLHLAFGMPYTFADYREITALDSVHHLKDLSLRHPLHRQHLWLLQQPVQVLLGQPHPSCPAGRSLDPAHGHYGIHGLYDVSLRIHN